MHWKYRGIAVLCVLMIVIPVLGVYRQNTGQAEAASMVKPAAQPNNTIVRWVRETQKNQMGQDIVMTLGYNHDGDSVVSILENERPIITVTTYDEKGNTVEVRSFDDGKQFVHSVYTYNEQGDQQSWSYQARTPDGVTTTEYTYEYLYDEQGAVQRDTLENGSILSRQTYTRQQTDAGTVVRTITDGDRVPDLTCYNGEGRPLWREKGTYRMVYYYDRLGRETENCVIRDGMQQNRTVTVYGDDGHPTRRILYGANQQDVVSVSEMQMLTTTPQIWLDFSAQHQTSAMIAAPSPHTDTNEQQQAQSQTTPSQAADAVTETLA